MKIINSEQNTPEWYAARLGIPTASEFDKILTATGKESTQADAYANRLLAEMIVGHPIKEFEGNGWTERGHEFEQEAANLYALQCDATPVKVGFVTDDAGTVGCSPDRLIGDDGFLEIKNPAAHTHMKYLLDHEALVKDYWTQVQGQHHVLRRTWGDIMSYFPEMPPVIVRMTPDSAYQTKLSGALARFNAVIAEKRARLVSLGLIGE